MRYLISMSVSPAEMYAAHIACCPLASHVKYAPRALLKLENRWNRQTDRRTPDRHRTLNARRGQRNDW